MQPYRAWINQPSKLQPLHAMHGTRGIVTAHNGNTVTIYFVDGPTVSMEIPRNTISRTYN